MLLWQRRLKYRFRSKKKTYAGTKQRKTVIGCFFLAILLLVGFYGFYRVELRIGSLAQQAATSKLNGIITKEVNRVVQEVFERESVHTQGLVSTTLDENGRVLSMTTDYPTLNRIKSTMAIEIQQILDNLDVVETTVPFGMLISDTFLTGLGFRVPVKVFCTNAIEVEYQDSFHSVGINQSRYCLLIQITVPAQVAGLFSAQYTKVVTQIPLAETIIAGEVPQALLNDDWY